ncbi:leukocyte elastase inhibitor-like [Lineus longissimus]|uniref:leukocyte elastase inhibitor-like n=1 Tax=Lineus longissimus TaxID=88925 RepID=UPI002B4C7D8A
MELVLKVVFVLCVAGFVVGQNEINNVHHGSMKRRSQSFKEYIRRLRQFSSDMYTQLSEEKPRQNLIFSPYSIESALMMTILGAKGNTWKQLRAGMRMGTDRQLRNNTRHFRSTMERLPDGYFFESANRVFYQNSSTISAKYLSLTEDVIGAFPQAVDFKAPDVARDTINRWVEKKTKNKIKDLISDGVLDELVRMVLVNAVYFKADWKTKFDAQMTKEKRFFSHDDEQVVDMMDVTSKFKYKEDEECNYKAVEMEYKGGSMSMVLVLPMHRTNQQQFQAFEECLQRNIETVTKQMVEWNVNISLPKFKLTQHFDLKEPLKRMSIVDLFIPGKANLTGIDPTGDLYVSDALHKVFIEVNEEGSEAAAATAMVSRGRSAFGDPVLQFVADHPFMFFIKHKVGGVIFMGRVMNPSANP